MKIGPNENFKHQRKNIRILQWCKEAPALWQAQRKYEEKHEALEVRADEEMDVGV